MLANLCVFVGMVLIWNTHVEWVFHRFFLHAIIWRPLRWLADSHRQHHRITSVSLVSAKTGPGRVVLNRYPIVIEEQFESSAFPWYALPVFWILFSPLLIALQVAFPRLPFVLAGYSAVTWSLVNYEVIHAINHWPYEWWKQATEHPRFGALWRKIYGFHLTHHAKVKCNENISGFFGLPVADWWLGTYYQPKELLLDGRLATANDFVLPKPRRIVQWLDSWAKKREAEIVRNK